jgi:hypothetical protein
VKTPLRRNPRFLQVVIGILVLLDLFVLYDRASIVKATRAQSESLITELSTASLKLEASSAESQVILNGSVQQNRIDSDRDAGDCLRVGFLFYTKATDCSNCIDQEVRVLNQLYLLGKSPVTGYYLPSRDLPAQKFINVFGILFDIITIDSLGSICGIRADRTPFIVVVDSPTARILDAYQPEPNNLEKRNAFYSRWQRVLQIPSLSLTN